MEPLTSDILYPDSPVHLLKERFVGKSIRDVDGPAAVLDRKVLERNCKIMLDAAATLGTSFRAHVKTHKTQELSRLQVGNDATKPAYFIGSTVTEVERLVPLAQELASHGRDVNILYGIAPSISSLPRLRRVRQTLGPNSLSFLVDDPTQLDHISCLFHGPGDEPAPTFLKVDVGYKRAGLTLASHSLSALLAHAHRLAPSIRLLGFYTHYGTSYSASSPEEALTYLSTELEQGLAATALATAAGFPAAARYTISVGATPTAAAAQNLLAAPTTPAAARAADLLQRVTQRHACELHAGVYPVLDLQQLATRARPAAPAAPPVPTMDYADIGLRIVAEALTVYTERERPEVLVGAGVIALGREPCKAYPGWAVVAPLGAADAQGFYDAAGERTGWIVGRVAQEHGLLTWEGAVGAMAGREVRVGQKVALWPNHACIASMAYGWYFVVDGDEQIVDVWARWRGW